MSSRCGTGPKKLCGKKIKRLAKRTWNPRKVKCPGDMVGSWWVMVNDQKHWSTGNIADVSKTGIQRQIMKYATFQKKKKHLLWYLRSYAHTLGPWGPFYRPMSCWALDCIPKMAAWSGQRNCLQDDASIESEIGSDQGWKDSIPLASTFPCWMLRVPTRPGLLIFGSSPRRRSGGICGRAMVGCWLRDPYSSTRLLMLGVKASVFWKMSSSKICLSHARENYQVSSGVKYGLIESSTLVQHIPPKSTQFHLSTSPLNIIEWQFFGYAGKISATSKSSNRRKPFESLVPAVSALQISHQLDIVVLVCSEQKYWFQDLQMCSGQPITWSAKHFKDWNFHELPERKELPQIAKQLWLNNKLWT